MDPTRPPTSPELPGRIRRVRSLASAFVVALAFVAGDLAAAFLPGAALRFHSSLAGARASIAGVMSPLAFAAAAAVAAALLSLALVWLAGKPLDRVYRIPAVLLFLGSAVAGFYPVGREIRAERDVAALETEAVTLRERDGQLRVKSAKDAATAAAALAGAAELRKQLEDHRKAAAEASEAAAKQSGAKEQAMTRDVQILEKRVKELTTHAQDAETVRDAATAERDKAAVERDKALATIKDMQKEHQTERKLVDGLVDSLRKEISDLKKKLAEK